MPVELQIIRAREFVRLGAHGEFDFESTCAALTTLADACRKRGIERALIDIREASSNLTPQDLTALVKAFSDAIASSRLWLVVLHTDRQKYRAKLFAFLSAMRNRKVQAFEDFEEGLVWLSTPDDTAAKAAAGEDEVPIRSGKRSKTIIPVKEELTDQ